MPTLRLVMSKYYSTNRGAVSTSKNNGQWCFIFGAESGKGVAADTNMVNNALEHILFRQHPEKKFVVVPDVLD